MTWLLLAIGFAVGGISGSAYFFCGMCRQSIAHGRELDSLRSHHNWENRRLTDENQKLKEAITEVQQTLSVVRPPQTTHEVKFK